MTRRPVRSGVATPGTAGVTRRPAKRPAARPANAPVAPVYVAETAPGLERFLWDEISGRFGRGVSRREAGRPGEVCFSYHRAPRELSALKTASAVYRQSLFRLPRPASLLGAEHVGRIAAVMSRVSEAAGRDAFDGFRFEAAGKESSTFRELGALVSRASGLEHLPGEGSMVVRVRKSPDGTGWEVLTRTSPRPLSVRSWRVRDYPGALSGPTAAALVAACGPRRNDRVLNVGCGSGTLLVEWLLSCRAARAVGVDRDPKALAAARANVAAAGIPERAAELVRHDWARLPFEDGSFSAVVSDLPWGERVGRRDENAASYRALVSETGRLTAPGGRGFFLTQHDAPLREALAGSPWTVVETFVVGQRGFTPTAFLIER